MGQTPRRPAQDAPVNQALDGVDVALADVQLRFRPQAYLVGVQHVNHADDRRFEIAVQPVMVEHGALVVPVQPQIGFGCEVFALQVALLRATPDDEVAAHAPFFGVEGFEGCVHRFHLSDWLLAIGLWLLAKSQQPTAIAAFGCLTKPSTRG